MPMPEGRALTQNYSPRLTNLALSYLPDQSVFIGRDVFPGIGVGAASGDYNIFPRGAFLRLQGKELANGEAPPVGGFDFTKGVYSVSEWGLSAPWTQRDLNNAAVGGIGAAKLAEMKTKFVSFQGLLWVEQKTATLVRTAGNWSVVWTGKTAAQTPDGVTQFLKWSDHASDPISFVKGIKTAMQLKTGFRPNKMLMGRAVLDVLAEHPEFLDRVKYNGSPDKPAKVSKQAIAGLFEFDDILVPESVVNTAQEGAADSIGWIWGTDVFIWFAPDAPSTDVPSAGYRFNWNGAVNSDGVGPQPFGGKLNNEGLYISRYVTQRPAAEWAEARWYTVPLVTGADLGVLLVGAI